MGDQTGEVEDLERILTDTSAEPIKISFAAIKYVTKNFAVVIGEGGFGVVYLGGLQNGMIAVKKLFQTRDLSDKQFLDEVTKLNHTNVVRFLGYCADTQGEVMEYDGKYRIVEVQQRLLCFEYVPNGNLHNYLKDKTYGYEWSVCYQIIKGICQGLYYIHQEHVYHLDLKPGNVLLGVNMEPKITDFGLSRYIGEQSTMVTQKIIGTRGYMAPEFIDKHQISQKSDIFSLGVIMINLLTGCNGYVMENWHTTIDVKCPQMKRCIEIAQICVNTDPRNRPTTGEIIKSLNETETMDHASQRYKQKIKEPRNDPRSTVNEAVQRFWAIPAKIPREHAAREAGSQVKYHINFYCTSLEIFLVRKEVGRGQLATIYKGILLQREVAVKRLMMTMEFNDQKFQNLIKTMMLVPYRYTVRFLGYCYYSEGEAIEYQGELVIAETQERLLCFEYLSNGSLQRYISDASSGLEWRQRYEIILGICKGLDYLHGNQIIHMDLNPRHILLDDNMVPKISNFYMSRCFTRDQLQITVTQSEMGTVEYIAPEFINNGVVSFKSDIYSLGVTIREILTGGKEYYDTQKILESWDNRLLLHPSSEDTLLLEQVRVCAEISRACVADDPDQRPDTGHIIRMLTNCNAYAGPSIPPMDDTLHTEVHDLECILEGSKKPGALSSELLLLITGNFSKEQVIGEDGLATTYKCILGKQIVAVKMLSKDLYVFQDQIITMSWAKHKNIVQFLGYCSYTAGEATKHPEKFVMAKGRERLICFEYLSNGSLSHYISDASGGLEWKVRYQILKGICEGSYYLHRNRIIHLDLKPANILLDETMVPKIADFGLSNCLAKKQSRLRTAEQFGSLAYIAPEFIKSGVVSLKSDIYSFGIITRDILTGRKDHLEIESVLESWRTRLGTSSTDKLLEQVRVCADISIACIEPKPENRPAMHRVIERLRLTEC